MATQTQGKGKKKNKEVTKVSLDEFNSFDAPHGHSVVSVKMTGLDWAATMADHELAAETQQIVVPVAPRAQRGPAIEFDAIPDTPPFRASLYNVPMSADEKDIQERFLVGTNVTRVDISSKTSTTVEFATKHDLYEALSKDGNSFKGKTVNVCLYGQTPRNEYSERYGGRGGSYGDRFDRGQSGGFGGSRMGDRYGERSGGGFGRDREYGGGYNRAGGGGFGSQRAYGEGFSDRGTFREIRGSYTSGGGEPSAEEPENWRDRPTVKPLPSYNNGSRQPYMHPRSDPPQYHAPSQQYHHPESYNQPRYNQHHNQPPNHSPPPFRNDRPGSRDQPYNSVAPPTADERPKLVLQKRKTPLNVDDVSSVTRNEAIFGKAKPSSTPYQKMKEVEEKLSSVHISDRKSTSQSGSQAGSQPGSAPRSRQVSERSRE